MDKAGVFHLIRRNENVESEKVYDLCGDPTQLIHVRARTWLASDH